jgi:hypothetical protein
LNHLCGPSARLRPNSQLYSAAQSRDQAGLIFNLALKMIRMNRDLAAAVRVRESAKELVCPELGTSYKALSAEASTAFGLSPALTIFDELGQCKGPRSPLFEALETATGAQEEPLSIIISTQAPTDNDLLSILIDDAQAGHDPRTTLSLYTAPRELDPFDVETIKLANPAFDTFMNRDEVLAMANNARRMPAREAEYRKSGSQSAYRGQQRVHLDVSVEDLRNTSAAPRPRAGLWRARPQCYDRLDRARVDRVAQWQMASSPDILVAVRGSRREGCRRSRPL